MTVSVLYGRWSYSRCRRESAGSASFNAGTDAAVLMGVRRKAAWSRQVSVEDEVTRPTELLEQKIESATRPVSPIARLAISLGKAFVAAPAGPTGSPPRRPSA
jgi:hypothetical protein